MIIYLLLSFFYNNSDHSNIHMDPFESLYWRRCTSSIGWFKVGNATLIGPDFVHQAMEKVILIREKLKTAQSWQKSYSNKRRRDLQFEVDDWVFLKVTPMNGVIRFCKKGNLGPRYIFPYHLYGKIGKVAYELEIPMELAGVHPVFYVSMFKKRLVDQSLIVPLETVGLKESLSFQKVLVQILNRQILKLSIKEVASIIVLQNNQFIEEAMWEDEQDMKSRYLQLFTSDKDAKGNNTPLIPDLAPITCVPVFQFLSLCLCLVSSYKIL